MGSLTRTQVGYGQNRSRTAMDYQPALRYAILHRHSPALIGSAVGRGQLLRIGRYRLVCTGFFAVGHHLPGFMRVYGERELFDRHKAQFLIAPVVIAALVGWSVYNGHLGFFILLALWDMWHFFMQHYGLMRI